MQSLNRKNIAKTQPTIQRKQQKCPPIYDEKAFLGLVSSFARLYPFFSPGGGGEGGVDENPKQLLSLDKNARLRVLANLLRRSLFESLKTSLLEKQRQLRRNSNQRQRRGRRQCGPRSRITYNREHLFR